MESREKVYEVPRPVRAPKNIGGLTGKGLVLFAFSSLFFGTAVWFGTSIIIENFWIELVWKVVGVLVVLGVSYQTFKVDEESGEMAIEPLLDWMRWKRTDHIISPEWEKEPLEKEGEKL